MAIYCREHSRNKTKDTSLEITLEMPIVSNMAFQNNIIKVPQNAFYAEELERKTFECEFPLVKLPL